MCRPTGSSAPDPLLPFDAASCERLLSGRARRLNVVVRVWTNVRRWPGCDFRRAPHFDQSRDANATVVARQAGAQAHPPPVRYLSNGYRNFPVLRRAERLPPACIAPTGIRTGSSRGSSPMASATSPTVPRTRSPSPRGWSPRTAPAWGPSRNGGIAPRTPGRSARPGKPGGV